MSSLYKCDGCGMLSPNGPQPGVGDGVVGHHVIPDDTDKDWICHGRLVEMPQGDTVAVLYRARGVSMLDAAQPSKAELVQLGDADLAKRDARVKAITDAIEASIPDDLKTGGV